MENKDVIFSNRVTYFSNDVNNLIENELDDFMVSPIDGYDRNGISLEDVLLSVIRYLREEKIEDMDVDTKAREIIRSMGSMLDFDENKEGDKVEALLNTIKGTKCFQNLCKDFEKMLWGDNYFIEDGINFYRDDATYLLREDGFKPDTYIILGNNMGWRHNAGYKIAYINDERDMENAVTGNYEYTIEIGRPDDKTPYLEAMVSSHDSPMGEYYIFIPVKNLKEALKYPEVKNAYEKFRYLIEMDLAEAETA